MSQYGMQMPGGSMQRGPTMNVYTGLLFAAVVALASACGYVYFQAGKVSPESGNPFKLQAYDDQTKHYKIEFPAEK